MRHYKLKSEDAGKRLDQYITSVKPDLTRAFIQKLIKDGNVFVNNKKTTKSSSKLKEGDELMVTIPSIREVGILAENIPLDVVYEDSDIVVVNKAAGMVVHPTDHGAHVSGTLVNALMHHCKDLSGIGGEKRPGIVHRLDKDTSGLIITAKNDKAHHFVSKQIQDRTVVKKYITLLKGHLSPKNGSIEAPLIKSQAGGKKDVQISGKAKAKYALTHYEVLEYVGDYSLVEVQIVTGRTHQIRVHFKAIGHPVCGDTMYGDAKINEKLREAGLTRQFLHAAELTFKKPAEEMELHLKAPLAKDLEALLKKLTALR
ncbi:MAG: RluA family pseudouridine synthase [Candidatus Peregrinibacteria bacterium]|nr:RluA family pseudouridine synthase [Candidatus Peregrinibacteria bacterium]